MAGLRELRLRLGGKTVHYLETGRGDPVVIAHGLGLSGRFWAKHCEALARAGHRAIAPDLPGFGLSDGPRPGHSVADTAAWLLAFADALGLEHPVWLGHSIATQAVLELAATAPARARALILVTPTGAPGPFRRTRQLIAFFCDIAREPFALVPAVASEYLRSSLLTFLATWWRAGRDRPLDKAGRVRCPTLIVAGRRDPIVSRRFLVRLRRAIPRSRVVGIPGGAHGVMFARPAAFDAVVIRFLEELRSLD